MAEELCVTLHSPRFICTYMYPTIHLLGEPEKLGAFN